MGYSSYITIPGRIMFRPETGSWYRIGSASLKLYFTVNTNSFVVDKISLINISKANSSHDYAPTINSAILGTVYSWMSLKKGSTEKIIIPHPISASNFNHQTLYPKVNEERFLKESASGNDGNNYTVTIALTNNDYGVYELNYGSDDNKLTNSGETRFWLSSNGGTVFCLDNYNDSYKKPKIEIFPNLGEDPSQTTTSGIITNNTITATRVIALRDYIKALYSYRGLSITGTNPNNTNQELTRNLSTDFSSWNPSITSGTKIDETNLGDILNHALVINDFQNLKYSNDGQKIFYNGSTSDLLTFFSEKYNKSATATDHGCRGACLGICSGGCYNNSTGSGSNNVTACSGCGSGCVNDCNVSCSGSSNAQCDCFNCTGECWGSCTGNCGGCGTACWYGCSSGCQATCSGGCATDCNNGCFIGCKSTCVTIASSTS